VREPRNVIERLVLLSSGREIGLSDLPEALLRADHRLKSSSSAEVKTLEELEREQIERVLSIEHNQERAAKILGITTVTLWRKRKQFGLP
jgi:NtrC-family two-component system response regulator AlgB